MDDGKVFFRTRQSLKKHRNYLQIALRQWSRIFWTREWTYYYAPAT